MKPGRGTEESVEQVVEGGLPRAVLGLALPAAGSMLISTAFGIVDTFWVGRMGREAVAAMSASSYFLWSMYALVALVDVGTHAHVARRSGERDWPAMARAAGEGIVLCMPVAAVAIVFYMAIAGHAFAFMGASGEVTRMAREYLDVILFGLPVTLVFMVVGAVFRGSGDTRTPFWLLGGCFLINAFLDPVLIFGLGPAPAMGLGGAALATVGSHAAGAVIGLVLLARGRLVAFARPVLTLRSLSILRIGLPTFFEGFLFCVVYVFLVKMLLPFGVSGLAALGIGHRLEGLTYMFSLGFAHAAAVLVGQSLGAGKPGRAARGAWLAAGIVAAFALAISVLFLSASQPIISLFVDDRATIEDGGLYLRIVGLTQVAMAVELVLAGAFQGAGDTVPPMIVSSSLTAVRVPLAYVLASSWGMGASGIYWAISLSTLLKGATMSLWFANGRWKRSRL